MRLSEAEEGKEYTVVAIETDDDELNSFLFSLGCYSGEPVTVISHPTSIFSTSLPVVM
jgi:ferrous iron transport protein A